MYTNHDLDPMLVSWCVAVASAYAAFDLGTRLASFDGARRWLWLLASACAAGSGIWAAHFTGMQAAGLPPGAAFAPGLVLLSWLAAVGAALLGLHLISRPEPEVVRMAGGGLAVGLVIVLMHGLGLAALRPTPHYDLALLGAAALLAAALSVAALLAGFSLRRLPERQLAPGKGCGALLAGAALGAMHHVLMAAVQVPAAAASAERGLPADWLGLSLALFTIAFIAAVMLLSMFDAQRQEAHWQERQRFLAARFRRRLARG